MLLSLSSNHFPRLDIAADVAQFACDREGISRLREDGDRRTTRSEPGGDLGGDSQNGARPSVERWRLAPRRPWRAIRRGNPQCVRVVTGEQGDGSEPEARSLLAQLCSKAA